MKKPQQYKTLGLGEVREKGDQSRVTKPVTGPNIIHPSDEVAEWRPSTLLGHAILASDLMHLEFRRAV